MAIADAGDLGTGGSTSSGTTLAFSPAATLEAGNVGILAIGFDNASGNDGDNDEIQSVTDSVGNTWTKLAEFANGQGSAGAGAVIALWRTKATTNLTSAGTVTVTFKNTITAKSATLREFTVASGKTLAVAATSLATLAVDNGAVGSVTSPPSGSLSNKEYLFYRATASERGTLTWTATANYTKLTQGVADTGTNNTSLATNGEFRVVTATTETSNPSGSQSVDHASLMVALEEVDVGGGGGGFKSAFAHGTNKLLGVRLV